MCALQRAGGDRAWELSDEDRAAASLEGLGSPDGEPGPARRSRNNWKAGTGWRLELGLLLKF